MTRSTAWTGWRLEPLIVAVAALAILSCMAFFEADPPRLRYDQEWIDVVVLKYLHPHWFEGDAFFGHTYYQRFAPAFITMQAAVARLRGDDPVKALRVLFWPFGFLFLIGHYVLFRSLTGSALAAGLGTLSAIAVRNALGGEYWGFGGVSSVQERTIITGATPLLMWIFLRWRSHRFFPVFFLSVGALANLHPVSGLHLAEVTAITHLCLARFRFVAWKHVGIGIVLFSLGALPFIITFVSGRENVTDSRLFAEIRNGVQERFDYLFLPPKLDAVLSVAFHASLGAALLVWLRRRGYWTEDLRVLALFGGVALGLGFMQTALIQAWLVVANRPYVDIHQLRATKFMYVPVVAAFPIAFRALLQQRTVLVRVGLSVVFLASLVPPALVIHSFSREARQQVKAFLHMGVATEPANGVDARASVDVQEALWKWAVTNTRSSDVFFTDSADFRLHTLRPITGSGKDTAITLAGTAPLYRWLHYLRDVETCRAVAGDQCWFSLARTYHANYVVVDPELSRAAPDDGAVRVWAEDGWSVWRLQASASTE